MHAFHRNFDTFGACSNDACKYSLHMYLTHVLGMVNHMDGLCPFYSYMPVCVCIILCVVGRGGGGEYRAGNWPTTPAP